MFVIVFQRLKNFQWSTQADLAETLAVQKFLTDEEILSLMRLKRVQQQVL